MPPKARFSRDEIVAAAVDIIRDSGAEAITAQEIGRRMGSSSRPMFTWFRTLEELRAAARERAWEIYNGYIEQGLAMTPAFKGFAMAYVRFASEEPSLFRLLFMRKDEPMSLPVFLDREGHLPRIRETVMETFHLDRARAEWLYENMWIYGHGVATLCAGGAVRLTEAEIADKLGTVCRALLMLLHAPKDARTAILPSRDTVMPGSVEDYVSPPWGKEREPE